MDSDERTGLNNRDMLFTLLTALVKKNDGEIRISEDEMDAVTKKDMMMMYYDKGAKEIILSLSLLTGPTEGDFC
jgi:5,10-methenyltetrahydromethanopterin hydrogenase